MSKTVHEQIVGLINDAQTLADDEGRLRNLREVLELIIHQDPTLLDNFLDEILSFQNDPSVDVRQFVVTFIEEACKKDPEILSKIVANLMIMLGDANVTIHKAVILSCERLYPLALKWVTTSRNVSEIMEHTWDYFVQLKSKIVEYLGSSNDGVRTRVLKFIESCIVLQSVCPANDREGSSGTTQQPDDSVITLNQVPRDHRFISYRRLEAEGKTLFQKLLDFMTGATISSINLITCISVLSRIARLRPEFMEKAVIAFETLQVNIPASLAKAQVTSVRKELKKHLFALLKAPETDSYFSQVTTLLTDLGATQSEINKAVPSERRKRMKKLQEEEAAARKRHAARQAAASSAVEQDDDDDGEPAEKRKRGPSAIDVTADDLYGKLTVENVAELVLLSMLMLPDTMPAQFQSSYTPIAAAGTPSQIKHLARLMAAQFNAVGLGKGADMIKQEKEKAQQREAKEAREASSKRAKTNVVMPVTGFQSQKSSKRLHQFGLAHITKPMTANQLLKMTCMCFQRIMKAEKRVKQGGAAALQMKLLVSMVTQFNVPSLQQMLLDYIISDQKSRADVAILWIFQEYASYQGFNESLLQDQEKGLEKYNECLTRILGTLLQRGDHKESLFHRIFLESPQVTPAAQGILRKACEDTVHSSFALDTLKQMILRKPRQRTEFLTLLLEFTTYENTEIRNLSLNIAKQLYENPMTRESVSWHMNINLRYLLQPNPPHILFTAGSGRPVSQEKWTEESIKACLYLHLYLMPSDHSLVHELATIYVETQPDIKRVILRQLETPIRQMGMDSPDLLSFVETCPKGAETLVTRIVHLLTERSAPSVELVNRIRDLYHKRVPDVRFLIPVLTGLTKKEIITALPKLIKLNVNVVKEVFNRLLHGHAEDGRQTITPSELLIALHQLDPAQVDSKSLAGSTNLLLLERAMYTQEVMAAVIQQLVDHNPLPSMLMRTVNLALQIHPRLSGFVMNILQRLIMKQVWKQPQVWSGFVKCCQRTKPQSFQVLLQLPPTQLKQVFRMGPDLRDPLLQHINSLSAHQQAYISPVVMKVVQTDPAEYMAEPGVAPPGGVVADEGDGQV